MTILKDNLSILENLRCNTCGAQATMAANDIAWYDACGMKQYRALLPTKYGCAEHYVESIDLGYIPL